ncbi:MAG: hypothetical protein ACT4NL_16320 [Pseudomarimonas sp.]
MSLDLFFVSRKPAFSELRAADFTPTPAMQRARKKLIKELIEAFPGTRLEGNESKGHFADFPRGDLSVMPGYLSWSGHGVTDQAPIHDLVTWFREHGLICEDPQDAGFGNRDLKRDEERTELESFEELVGAAFVGVRYMREWGNGISFDWILADGCAANVQFVHFQKCCLPDLGPLVKQQVIGVHFETGHFNTLRVFFPDDQELLLEGAIFKQSSVVRKLADKG